MKLLIGYSVALTVGIACGKFKIPLPAPTDFDGVGLIFTLTLGYCLGCNLWR